MTVCVTTHPVIDTDELLPIDAHITELTFDPTGSTITLKIGATTYGMAWVGGTILGSDGYWSQYAKTTMRFAGTAVVAIAPDVNLPAGRYLGKPVITLIGGSQVSIPATPIDIL